MGVEKTQVKGCTLQSDTNVRVRGVRVGIQNVAACVEANSIVGERLDIWDRDTGVPR